MAASLTGQQLIYRSTDGGNTWTNTYTGPYLPWPAGGANSGFFAMYVQPAPLTGVTWAGVSRPPSTT